MAKSYKLSVLAPARMELIEIAQLHMELSGPDSARKITNNIKEALKSLKKMPRIGAPLQEPELRRNDYRKLICGKYLCIYRLIGDTVFVYHIVDGRRNYPLLFRDLPDK